MKRYYYKEEAAHYDTRWKNYTKITLYKLMEYMPATLAGKKILDWGCGTGELIQMLLLRYPDVASIMGYDPSAEMLEQAQTKIRQFPEPLQQKVALQSEQHFNTKFDLIVSSSVFHYLPNPNESLLQFKSLLAHHGELLLLDYTKSGFLVKYFEWTFKLLDARHQQAYYGRQIREMVEKKGFRAEQEESFSISPLWKGYLISASVKDEL